MNRPIRLRLLLGCLIALSLTLGWYLRWILDDAYISFRYAWNWVHGYGLVFNPGEPAPVEGYTNFLWTVLSALPIALGLDPTIPMLVLGLACAGAALLATWALARSATGDERLASLAVALVGLNFSFLCFATSGLETMLQTALLTAALALALRTSAEPEPSRGALVALSLSGAAALLTRLDSAVPGAVILAGWWLRRRAHAPRDTERRSFALLLGPAAAILAVWFAWKLATYGALLPNTWTAREHAVPIALRLDRGLRFVAGFATDYWLWPFLALAFGWLRLWKRAEHALLACALAAWWAYVIFVGADYMEYRFMVPLLPALVVLLVASTAHLQRWAPAMLAVALLAGSGLHARSNEGSPIGHGRLGPVANESLSHPEPNPWSGLRRLVAGIPGSEELRWTLPAIGAAGYYSRFQLVDMHGLTDEHVARHGQVGVISPAHDKWAPIAYLRERGVSLADSRNDPCYYRRFYGEALADETLVRVGPFEVAPGKSAIMLFLYVTPHPAVERLIAERGERFALPSYEACRKPPGR